MRIGRSLFLALGVFFFLTIVLSPIAAAKRKETNNRADVLYMFGGIIAGGAVSYLGDGGVGAGIAGSGDDNGFNGGGWCFFGDTFLLSTRSIGLTLAGGWILDASKNHKDIGILNAMFVGAGFGWKRGRIRVSIGPGYAITDSAEGPVGFGGVTWGFRESEGRSRR